MGAPKNSKQAREERERMLILKHKMDNRITTTRHGKESLDSGDYGGAIRKFNEYLLTIAEAKGATNIYGIKVHQFDPQKDLTEMLMISHVYFEMARIYDASSKFQEDSQKCLEQFVHFSANQPYQVVNSELVRKYLKKSVFKNHENFRNAYQQIYVQSKKCYVVTFCYGNSHPVTQDYRALKDVLLESQWGREFVRLYYKASSDIVPTWSDSKIMRFIGRYFFAPTLLLFSKTLLRLILKR